MAVDVEGQWFQGLSELRQASTPKRIRARLDGRTVLDTRDALLVWEPHRVVPMISFQRPATVYVDGEAVDTAMPGE